MAAGLFYLHQRTLLKISAKIERPSLLEKPSCKVRFFANRHFRNYRQKVTGTTLFQTAFHRIFSLSHKRPTFAFTGESGYTLGSRRKIAHSGTHGETGAFRTGPLSLPSTRTARSRTSPGRVSERRTLPLWDLGREVLSKNAESLRDSDALMRVAVPRRRGPAGLRDLFRFCRNCGLYALRSGPFRVCEARGGITTLSALYVLLKRRTAACQNGSFAVF